MNEKKENIYSRDKILQILSTEINTLNKKIKSGRIANLENEKIRINQHRALIYGCNTYNGILKDKQVDILINELVIIKEAITNDEELYNLNSKEMKKVDKLLAEVMEE